MPHRIHGPDDPLSDPRLDIPSRPLDLPFEPYKLARRLDPPTSAAAASAARTLTGNHERIIIAYLEGLPDTRGRTKNEIADALGLDGVAVARRMRRIADAGLAAEAGHGLTPAGRSAILWRSAAHPNPIPDDPEPPTPRETMTHYNRHEGLPESSFPNASRPTQGSPYVLVAGITWNDDLRGSFALAEEALDGALYLAGRALAITLAGPRRWGILSDRWCLLLPGTPIHVPEDGDPWRSADPEGDLVSASGEWARTVADMVFEETREDIARPRVLIFAPSSPPSVRVALEYALVNSGTVESVEVFAKGLQGADALAAALRAIALAAEGGEVLRPREHSAPLIPADPEAVQPGEVSPDRLPDGGRR